MKTEDAVRALAAYTKEEVSRLETRLQQLQDTHCEEKIAGLETDVASLRSRKGVDDKQVSEELQKRVHDIEQTLTTLAVYIKEETSSQAESKVGERIDALEDHIDELRNSLHTSEEQLDAKERLASIEPLETHLEQQLRDDDAERAAVQKAIADLRQKFVDVESRLAKVGELQGKASAVEHHVEQIAERTLASGLATFSRQLDHLYPTLASKTEFEKFATALERKISLIEVPDISHIEHKVEDLEGKVLRLLSIVEDIYNRLPAVVE